MKTEDRTAEVLEGGIVFYTRACLPWGSRLVGEGLDKSGALIAANNHSAVVRTDDGNIEVIPIADAYLPSAVEDLGEQIDTGGCPRYEHMDALIECLSWAALSRNIDPQIVERIKAEVVRRAELLLDALQAGKPGLKPVNVARS